MNRNLKHFFGIVVACSAWLVYSFAPSTENWTQFRGPESNLVVTGNLPAEWNDSLNVRWKTDLTGDGWSSPIVFGDKIFITSAFLEKAAPASAKPAPPPPPPPPASGAQQRPSQGPPPPQPEDNSYKEEIYRWELTCFDLKNGKELWKQVAFKGTPRIPKNAQSSYACETPVTDGKRIYAYFGMTGVFCYDFDGKLLWKKDLGAFKTLNNWGTGASPVLYKDILYVQADNEENSFVVALDAATGNEKWKMDRTGEATSYSTPVVWKNKFRTELVTIGKSARSYDPATGKLNWELKMGGEMALPSPVFDNERIYLGKTGGTNKPGILYAVKAGVDGNITPADSGLVSNGVEWTLRETGVGNPSPLLHNGLIYLLSSRGGEIYCLDAKTGAQVYKAKADKVGACWASPWVYADKIYFYDEKGITQVIQAGKEFKVLSQNKLNDKFWASIAVADDAYIFKGVKKLYCVKK
jgi:outer membrane protein assembly factor BamB